MKEKTEGGKNNNKKKNKSNDKDDDIIEYSSTDESYQPGKEIYDSENSVSGNEEENENQENEIENT